MTQREERPNFRGFGETTGRHIAINRGHAQADASHDFLKPKELRLGRRGDGLLRPNSASISPAVSSRFNASNTRVNSGSMGGR